MKTYCMIALFFSANAFALSIKDECAKLSVFDQRGSAATKAPEPWLQSPASLMQYVARARAFCKTPKIGAVAELLTQVETFDNDVKEVYRTVSDSIDKKKVGDWSVLERYLGTLSEIAPFTSCHSDYGTATCHDRNLASQLKAELGDADALLFVKLVLPFVSDFYRFPWEINTAGELAQVDGCINFSFDFIGALRDMHEAEARLKDQDEKEKASTVRQALWTLLTLKKLPICACGTKAAALKTLESTLSKASSEKWTSMPPAAEISSILTKVKKGDVSILEFEKTHCGGG